ncbi:hypothetical protein L2E82_30031 [Cichorium intybus]|uniref:Uncharacterized protein n=1 Tax=Cichorium intybus TaxID=13427 RepID=A0ACB9CZE2_CICIN|nr:hypothetical protein L2E82_30031 [Cichorium intybus]
MDLRRSQETLFDWFPPLNKIDAFNISLGEFRVRFGPEIEKRESNTNSRLDRVIASFPPASFSAFVSVDYFSIIGASETLCMGSGHRSTSEECR